MIGGPHLSAGGGERKERWAGGRLRGPKEESGHGRDWAGRPTVVQAKKRKEREIDGPKGKLGLQLSIKKEERRERI
jgi:hypothetical protein